MTYSDDMTPFNNVPRLLILFSPEPPTDVGAELHAIMERLREGLLMAGLFTADHARDLERLAQMASALTTLSHDEGDPQAREWLRLRRLEG